MSLLMGYTAFGQVPNWQVNDNNFQYTMSFVAFLNIDGQTLNDPDDKVAAFVNGECRGVTNLTYVASEDQHYAYLTVFSNTNGESIQFKVYDASSDEIRDIEVTQNFEINQHYGDLFQAYSIASPQLSNAAEIIEIDFQNVDVYDQVFTGDIITFYVDTGTNVSSVITTFTLSSGAKLYWNRNEILTGNNNLDYSNPLTLEVVSENRAVIKEYTLVVNLNSADYTFYKKDAVCYNGGSIKVIGNSNGEEVVLINNGVTIKSGTIEGGQLIFDDLVAGDYTVRVSGTSKTITINLKN